MLLLCLLLLFLLLLYFLYLLILLLLLLVCLACSTHFQLCKLQQQCHYHNFQELEIVSFFYCIEMGNHCRVKNNIYKRVCNPFLLSQSSLKKKKQITNRCIRLIECLICGDTRKLSDRKERLPRKRDTSAMRKGRLLFRTCFMNISKDDDRRVPVNTNDSCKRG